MLSCEQIPTVGFDYVRIAKESELKPHTHAASETFIYILEGTAIATLDSRNFRVRAGDTIYIPAGVSHGFSTPDEAIAAWGSVQICTNISIQIMQRMQSNS
ncbi:MAG: cupin domain-containing protein, partial [Hydrococcus sp. CSU_1_8]|nr:cupin domain-containing protein [Hydrococcus sp. CSU_1_8]